MCPTRGNFTILFWLDCVNIFRMRSLRYLAVSKLIRRSISSEDFIEYGLELEDLKIFGSTITKIEASAFQHVKTIKTLDLSENNIDFIDPFAFAEVFSSLILYTCSKQIKFYNNLHKKHNNFSMNCNFNTLSTDLTKICT